MSSLSETEKMSKNCLSNCKYCILDQLDLFGKRLNIQVAGKEKHTTLTGTILGVISIIAIFALSVIFFIDLFYRTNVKIMYNQSRDMIPQNNLTDTPFVFGLANGLGKLINENVFDLKVSWSEYTTKTNKDGTTTIDLNFKDIPITKCDINKSFGKYKNLFEKIPYLNYLYCIPPNTFNLTLYGKYGDIINGFNYLNIYVNKCSNNTNTLKTCASSKEIDYRLTDVYFAFNSLDSEIDHSNSTLPHRKVLKSSTFLMSNIINKRYFYYVREVFYNTDYGYVLEENQKETFYQLDEYQFEDKLPDNTVMSPSIGTFTILNENKVDIYYRSYDKLQNIIANIGGVIKGILLTASIFNYIFNRNYSTLQIINSLFDFSDPEQELQQENENDNVSHFKRNFLRIDNSLLQSSKDQLALNINNAQNNCNNIEQDNTAINVNKNFHVKVSNTTKFNFDKKEKSNMKSLVPEIHSIKKNNNFNCNLKDVNNKENETDPKKLTLKLSSLILPSFISFEKAKTKILNNSELILDNYLSIQTIVQKFYEVEKLKKIILQDESQLKEFNKIPVPYYKEELEKITNRGFSFSKKY